MAELFSIVSQSPEHTLRIGRAIGAAVQPGDVIGLVGPLGAGKTQLVKGIAAGAGVADEGVVTSPTFVLVNEYDGRLHIFHLDAYRLLGPGELAELGFEEMTRSGGVVLVEWADRVRGIMPLETIWIDIESSGATSRILRWRGSDPFLRSL